MQVHKYICTYIYTYHKTVTRVGEHILHVITSSMQALYACKYSISVLKLLFMFKAYMRS